MTCVLLCCIGIDHNHQHIWGGWAFQLTIETFPNRYNLFAKKSSMGQESTPNSLFLSSIFFTAQWVLQNIRHRAQNQIVSFSFQLPPLPPWNLGLRYVEWLDERGWLWQTPTAAVHSCLCLAKTSASMPFGLVFDTAPTIQCNTLNPWINTEYWGTYFANLGGSKSLLKHNCQHSKASMSCWLLLADISLSLMSFGIISNEDKAFVFLKNLFNWNGWVFSVHAPPSHLRNYCN